MAEQHELLKKAATSRGVDPETLMLVSLCEFILCKDVTRHADAAWNAQVKEFAELVAEMAEVSETKVAGWLQSDGAEFEDLAHDQRKLAMTCLYVQILSIMASGQIARMWIAGSFTFGAAFQARKKEDVLPLLALHLNRKVMTADDGAANFDASDIVRRATLALDQLNAGDLVGFMSKLEEV